MEKTSSTIAVDPLEALRERRRAVFLLAQGKSETKTETDGRYCALALSGGGIRSATFSLGVIQAIALSPSAQAAPGATAGYANSMLSSIDYLSTVSGGGYIGSFLASLFLPGRLQPSVGGANADARAADDALKVLCVNPPGRIRADRPPPASDWPQFPLAWLRDNGRYLSPTGPGDMAYDIGLAIRNWVAVQYVIGTMFVLAFALLAVLRGPLWMLATHWHVPLLPIPPHDPVVSFEMWWSPTAYIAIALFVGWACSTGLAYWWVGKKASVFPFSLASWGALLVAVVLLKLSFGDSVEPRATTVGAFAALLLLSLVFYGASLYLSTMKGKDADVAQRVQLTRWLRSGLVYAAGVAMLAVLEALGQSLYLYVVARHGSPVALVSSLGTAGLLTVLVKRGVSFVTEPKGGGGLSRLPLLAIAGAAGVLIILCVALAWSFAFAWVLWGGAYPDVGYTPSINITVVVVGLAVFGLTLLTGAFPSFINLSSLQTLYAARLTRAYLGASNGHRSGASSRAKDKSAAEPVRHDDVELTDFVDAETKRPSSLAPFHLINVTLNSTVDPAEQLVQRDRKGLPMAVSPTGYWIDGDHYAFQDEASNDISETPSVGQWVSTSGAAVSTGLGRRTSLGLSLLLGAANVRLGTWWSCSDASKPSVAVSRISKVGRTLFRTQSYLADELRAKFYGLRRDWQYLSDGGHFENIALYEMLRPERKVGFAIATDAGADREYQFEDLAILIRLVRIDFRIELEVDASVSTNPDLCSLFGVPEEFQAWARAQRPDFPRRGAVFAKRAVLLKAHFPGRAPHCWIVLIKPVVPSDAAADVMQYALANPDFPQQTTADQFFDEAQWESYRKLGIDNGLRLLDPDIRAALRTHTGTALI